MTVVLAAIAFDHSRGSRRPYTLPLRFDESNPVEVPEWSRASPVPAVAAYVRDRLPRQAGILARFQAAPGEARLVEIQARSSVATGSAPLLPDLPPVQVGFTAAGDSGWRAFPLDTTGMITGGVAGVVCQWTWQLRRSSGESWTSFDASQHKIYIVLSTPTAPWLVSPAVPANRSLPWAQALDLACQWARGAQDVIDAASRITNTINGFGGELLTYDAAVGAPHYTLLGVPRFLCDAFIDRVRGGEGAGPLVNCSDCATIVSTFANLLGADLWQSKMGLDVPRFRLNPIMSIGSDIWSTLWGGFSFHEVAWANECTENDRIFDACLKTDGDGDPTSAPHAPSLPVSQVFGATGSGQYRDQLTAPEDRDVCRPQPSQRIRRPFTAQAVPFVRQDTLPLHVAIADQIRSFEGSKPVDADEYFIENFAFYGSELPEWSLTQVKSYSADARPAVILGAVPMDFQVTDRTNVLVSWWSSRNKPDACLRIDAFETTSAQEAQRTMARISSEIECPLLVRWEGSTVGDLALKLPGGEFVIFIRGNHVQVVRSAGKSRVDITAEAKLLDQWLTSSGMPTAAGAIDQTTHLPRVAKDRGAWRRFVFRRVRARGEEDRIVFEPGTCEHASVREYRITPSHASFAQPKGNAYAGDLENGPKIDLAALRRSTVADRVALGSK